MARPLPQMLRRPGSTGATDVRPYTTPLAISAAIVALILSACVGSSRSSTSATVPEDCFGLDQCQARLYTAIARHAVLVMAALAICAITAALARDRTDTQAPPPVRPGQPPPSEPGMIPLTIPEIKRLLAALTTRPLSRWLVIHWDAWTRRHQARSRWFHKRGAP